MITREQVANLRPGDVVELTDDRWPDAIVRGPIYDSAAGPCVAGYWLLNDGAACLLDPMKSRTLTVISRAPRPLYVNHDRTEPVPGDVARDVDGDAWRRGKEVWYLTGCGEPLNEVRKQYHPLTLLWDGETGQVVL